MDKKPVYQAHYVLEMKELVQKCIYCGLVIEDFRTAMVASDENGEIPELRGWQPGMIFIRGNMTTINPGEDFEIEYCCDKHRIESKAKMN